MSWKIEKKILQGLDTYCIINSNGAMRHATDVEIDMWTDIMKLKGERDELTEVLNKFGFKCKELVFKHSGKDLHDPKVVAKLSETKAKVDPPKVEVKKDYTTSSTPPFGKREEPKTLSLKEKLKAKYADRLKSANTNSSSIAGPAGKLPG